VWLCSFTGSFHRSHSSGTKENQLSYAEMTELFISILRRFCGKVYNLRIYEAVENVVCFFVVNGRANGQAS
jgi:predicted site-specific integrase-resolvase